MQMQRPYSNWLEPWKLSKQSGKKIIGYLHSPRQLDYLVYSVCDELIMDPAGTMLITGLAGEQLFLGDSFKSMVLGFRSFVLGVTKVRLKLLPTMNTVMRIVHRYKKFIESPLSTIYQTVATLRSMRLVDLNQTLAEKFIWKPKEAFEQGFVDQVDDFSGVIDRLIELGAEERRGKYFCSDWFGGLS